MRQFFCDYGGQAIVMTVGVVLTINWLVGLPGARWLEWYATPGDSMWQWTYRAIQWAIGWLC